MEIHHVPLIMQTAIGQGEYSGIANAYGTDAPATMANNGVLMKPYLIDTVVNTSGDVVSSNDPEYLQTSYDQQRSSTSRKINERCCRESAPLLP